jgi:hypothetical protein
MGAVCSVEQLPKPLPPTSKQAQKLSELVEKENQHFLQYKSSIPKKPLFGSSELTKSPEKLTDFDHDYAQFHSTPISQQTTSNDSPHISTTLEGSPISEDEGYQLAQTFHATNGMETSGQETPIESMDSEFPEQAYQSPLTARRSLEKEDSTGFLPVGSDCSSPENAFVERQDNIPSELSILTENDSWWSSEDEQHQSDNFQDSTPEKDHFKDAGPETTGTAMSPTMERDQHIML